MSCLGDRVATLHPPGIGTLLGAARQLVARERSGSNLRFVMVLAMLLVGASGAANAQYRSNGGVPPRAQLDAMVADTIKAFNNGLQQKDFTAFHSWVSTKAQQMFPAEKMLEVSQPLIDRKVNLAVLEGRKPTYAREPEIVEEGGMSVLRVKAVYQIKQAVVVKLQYITEKERWRLLTIDVSLK